ncbi:unnamed protein product, partial [Anisakis simplex]|uniref:Ovule protein n=1 Tax=Anisakis simplex TaxID=6269 RepID=A0A0M3JNP9_ANISI
MIEEESDESDVDSSDFFGLHSASTVPQLPVNYKPLTTIPDVNYGPSRPSNRLSQ